MLKHVFGPVPSRRLGISLGVDIVPFKTCSYDCIYCECGKTTNHTYSRDSFFDYEVIMSELREKIKKEEHLDYITFSGSGEPTLNSDIGRFISSIKEITEVPVAVLTNGSTLKESSVRGALLKADLVLPSIDACFNETFRRINRPAKNLDVGEINQGIIDFAKEFKGKIWLEIFFAKNLNDSVEEIAEFVKTAAAVNPEMIQLNTLDRPPAYPGTEGLSQKELESIAAEFKGMNAEVIRRVKSRREIHSFSENIEKDLLNTIERRPLTLEDLVKLSGRKAVEINKYIDVLEKEKKIIRKIVGDKIFFAPFKFNEKS